MICAWCNGPVIDDDPVEDDFCCEECALDDAYQRHVDGLIDEARDREKEEV